MVQKYIAKDENFRSILATGSGGVSSHNDLLDIQGGSGADGYYHLTNTQHTWLTDGVTAGSWGETKGGTGQTGYATGDILYADGSNSLAKLSASSDGYFLQLAGGIPTWGGVISADEIVIDHIKVGKVGGLSTNTDGYLLSVMSESSDENMISYIVNAGSTNQITAGRMKVVTSSIPSGGDSVVFTVRKNKTDTIMSVTVDSSTPLVGGYYVESADIPVSIVNGDVISVRFQSSGTTSVSDVFIDIEITSITTIVTPVKNVSDWTELAPGSWVETPVNSSTLSLSGMDDVQYMTPRTPIRWFDGYGTQDGYSVELFSGLENITGHSELVDNGGKLWVNVVDTGGSVYRVDIYSDELNTLLVGHTATFTSVTLGTPVAITEDNSSGIGGTITPEYLPATFPTGFYIRFYRYGVVSQYGVSTLTILGEPFSTGAAYITQIWRAPKSFVNQITIPISGAFGDGYSTTTLFADIYGVDGVPWDGPNARIVAITAQAHTVVSDYAYINVIVGGADISTSNSGDGLYLDDTNVHSTVVDISIYNGLSPGSIIEISSTAADAENEGLKVSMLVVIE